MDEHADDVDQRHNGQGRRHTDDYLTDDQREEIRRIIAEGRRYIWRRVAFLVFIIVVASSSGLWWLTDIVDEAKTKGCTATNALVVVIDDFLARSQGNIIRLRDAGTIDEATAQRQLDQGKELRQALHTAQVCPRTEK